ncbi:Ger(x)C family spore germination protein [Paenibacillus glycanilyticus]|uniref:Ger(x)C family spore germination protein n=1 Tax=Paenibacillus glycanilyticus TaxID=126569 RepID=UPI00203ACF02|nr:Ger(x)C family spore germination protein [Paenibacillus glycanilyticus]MCM3628361.1 Ger(x)C family spore germination protein [Paenibacillus glycanilyticus]
MAGLSFILLITSAGCTDFVEPNQLAFVIGSGIDYAGDGMIEISHQIAIPSKLSGSSQGGGPSDSESFIVVSAKGRNVFEANEKVQRKISRRLMTSHRTLVVISDELAEKMDLNKMFDKLNRDPANNQRDLLIMIKGSAKEFMKIKHPLEQLSSIATNKELLINGWNHYSIRQFMIDYAAEGTRAVLPFLQIDNNREEKDKVHLVLLSGYAVLNKQLKIKGILNDSEGDRAVWMAGRGTFQPLTIPWKEGNGRLSFRLTHLERQIHLANGKNHGNIQMTVKAQAYLLDNTTELDMSNVNNMVMVKKYLDERIQKDMQVTFNSIQQWGPDIFGIGEYYHRKHPYWWKSQRDDWDENFKKINVSIKANILLRSTGTSGGQLND